MTLFAPAPTLVKCNEHAPDYMTNPVINNAFSTTLALTLHRVSTVSSYVGAQEVATPNGCCYHGSWEAMSLNPTGGRGYLFVTLVASDAAVH